MKMLKILEKMQLTSLKGVQRAFYKMKITSKIQKTSQQQEKLNQLIEEHKKTIWK